VPEASEKANRVVDEAQGLVGDSELESAALALAVLRRCSALDTSTRKEVEIGARYGASKAPDSADRFREYLVEPLYEYVDEQLDNQRLMLGLLRRYKQKCEWFQRQELYETWVTDTVRGERKLALHLYEYLHDQGLQFYIEPWSASGEIDLIAGQESAEPLLADAKIFNPDRSHGKPYIVAGVHQLYAYTLNYNESSAYLVIYNTSPVDLHLALSGDALSVPYVVINNKTLWLVVVDIYPHAETASKRGKAQSVEITEGDLLTR
jgi:hypothetical protein